VTKRYLDGESEAQRQRNRGTEKQTERRRDAGTKRLKDREKETIRGRETYKLAILCQDRLA
jgi:hypothetical protein